MSQRCQVNFKNVFVTQVVEIADHSPITLGERLDNLLVGILL
jgi:hypothetical protein